MFFQENQKSKKQTVQIKLTKNSVISEGSHPFIKENWKKLLKGETLGFKFLSPPRQADYSFTVKKKEETKRSVTFILKASGLIVKLLSKSIQVTYDKRRKRITKYNGLTNIREEGVTLSANIIFLY